MDNEKTTKKNRPLPSPLTAEERSILLSLVEQELSGTRFDIAGRRGSNPDDPVIPEQRCRAKKLQTIAGKLREKEPLPEKTYFQLLVENRDYRPKSMLFTSQAEIDRLDRHFGLSRMDIRELQNLRDMTVLYYKGLRDGKMPDGQRTKEYFEISNAMMSVTAVIDSFKLVKKAFIVGFCPQTRVVVDVPDDFDGNCYTPTANEIIRAAREKIMSAPEDYLGTDNCDMMDEDSGSPYDAEEEAAES